MHLAPPAFQAFNWEQSDNIGAALAVAYPDIDPTTLSHSALRKLISRQALITDTATAPSEIYYELILDAWLEAVGDVPLCGEEDADEYR
ncbi:MAG: Fe-S cluster assembly protein IscX [Bdellovibrionales bacterium]